MPDATVSVMRLDLASLADIRRFADDYLASGRPLHALINNVSAAAAGVSESVMS